MAKIKEYGVQITVIFIAAILMAVMYYYWFDSSDKSNLESLFAGWAFIGLMATVILQSMELHFQRKELEETREVLARSAIAQENSEAALAKQINATNVATLVAGYNALLDYYDKTGNRQSSMPEVDQAKHVRARIKQIIANVEREQGWHESFGPRPVEWDRI